MSVPSVWRDVHKVYARLKFVYLITPFPFPFVPRSWLYDKTFFDAAVGENGIYTVWRMFPVMDENEFVDAVRAVQSLVAGLHKKMAEDVWPYGGHLYCKLCGHEQPFSTEEAASYLATDWPQHCGTWMRLRNLLEE